MTESVRWRTASSQNLTIYERGNFPRLLYRDWLPEANATRHAPAPVHQVVFNVQSIAVRAPLRTPRQQVPQIPPRVQQPQLLPLQPEGMPSTESRSSNRTSTLTRATWQWFIGGPYSWLIAFNLYMLGLELYILYDNLQVDAYIYISTTWTTREYPQVITTKDITWPGDLFQHYFTCRCNPSLIGQR